MSTYLQLAQRLRQECVGPGSSVQPSAVTSQVGQLRQFVDWIADAWTELQQERDDWFWMRKSFTVNTVASDGDYAFTECTDTVSLAAISLFAHWYKDSFKAYLSSGGVGGEYELYWMEWPYFRRRYRYGTQNDGPPVHVSMDPTLKFTLGPEPEAVYVVSGDYQIGPQVLAADANTPEMPSRFHMLIVYEAMMKYAGHLVAPDVMVRAAREGAKLRFALERFQLPAITAASTLA